MKRTRRRPMEVRGQARRNAGSQRRRYPGEGTTGKGGGRKGAGTKRELRLSPKSFGAAMEKRRRSDGKPQHAPLPTMPGPSLFHLSTAGNLGDRARHRRSGMGRSSGGGNDSGAAPACDASGRTDIFGADVNDLPRRRGSMDGVGRQRYYDSYWDRSYASNQRSWSTVQDHRRREGLQAGYGFFAVFAFFSFFLSMWMLFGLYGNQQLEMGMFYERVVKANSIFVKEVKIHFKEKGPVAYLFYNRPELGPSVSDKKIVEDIVVDPKWHKRFTYWLNSGSYVEVSCSLKDSGMGTDSLTVAIVKGEDGFQDWKGDPSNPSLALKWKRIHEKGVLSLKVEEDDDYCIVFGNLNNRKMTFSFKIYLRYVLYSKDNADFVCSSRLTDVCEFPVALGQSSYVLLTSPVVDMQGVEIWYTKLSYIPRWITYIFLWGLVAAGLLFTRAFELRNASSQVSLSQEHAPAVPEDASLYPALAPAYSALQTDETNSEKASVPENQHCTICLDAPKDSFFDPCGHRCTCYSCGMRIRGDSNRCPICRQTIRTVRRIYDA